MESDISGFISLATSFLKFVMLCFSQVCNLLTDGGMASSYMKLMLKLL
jgi:hypothetical protein